LRRGDLATKSDGVLKIGSVPSGLSSWLSGVGPSAKRWAVLIALVFAPNVAAAQPACPGDCDADASVEINELILGVNIILGRADVSSCRAFDVDANGTVVVSELVTAVTASLNGCETGPTRSATQAPSTPTEAPPTVTPTPTASVPAANGVVELRVFRSDDGTLYYVIGVDLASSVGIGAQINTVVMSDGAVQAVEEPFAPPDRVLTSFAGAISGSAVPVPRVARTGIISALNGNDIVLENPPNLANGEFDPGANDGRGLLTLPGGQRTVSIGGGASEAVHGAETASGSGVAFVPAAAVTTIRRQFRNNTIRAEGLVFPNPAGGVQTSAAATCSAGDPTPCDPSLSMPAVCGGAPCASLGGEVAGQNVTVDDTIGTRVGNEAAQANEVDGFFLHAGSDVIVFMVASASGPAPVNAAAAGFVVYGSCVGGPNDADPCSSSGDCPASSCGDGVRSRSVATAIGGRGVQIMPPLPPTATPTATPTVPPTSTVTSTQTVTQTESPLGSPSVTATISATPTATRAVSTGQCLRTGQTTCYDDGGSEISCTGTGQDGELRNGLPRAYVDNGDGTITDTNTGLMWEKLSDDGSVHDKDDTYEWADAFAIKVSALNAMNGGAGFAGYADWRLPNVNELQSLANYGRVSPAVSGAFNTSCAPGCTETTCSCTLPTFCWTSTTYQINPTNAWFVSFEDGRTPAGAKHSLYSVRAVRSGSTSGPQGLRLQTGQTLCYDGLGNAIACPGSGQDGELRSGLARAYVDNGDGTITDSDTGLMWERLINDGSVHDVDNTYSWLDAFNVKLAALNDGAGFAGHTDWRLPNANELRSLANYGRSSPAVNGEFFMNCESSCTVDECSCTQSGGYWSSTSSLNGPSAAWIVFFTDGGLGANGKSEIYYVRAVRGGS
jgi:hypothetical protein